MSASIFFILVGPAGSGKTTVRKHLLETFRGSLSVCVTATSRSPRPSEVDGVSYHFLTRDDFVQRIQHGDFVEWQETHGNLYGTLKKTLEDARGSGHDLVFDIDIRGALFFREHFPESTVVLFLVPPNAAELVARLRARGGSEEEIRTRLKTAEGEYSIFHANQSAIDYLVVNNDLPNTVAEVEAVVRAERLRCSRHSPERRAELCSLKGGQSGEE
jgi:guanylate kinase